MEHSSSADGMSMIECLSHQCMRVNLPKMQISIEDFDYLLKSARSVRRKLDFDRPISREDIEACIDVAVQAPTGIAGENWRFLVVTEPEPKAEIATIYNEILLEISSTRDMQLKASHRALMSRLHQIPCMIFIYAIGEPDEMLSGQIGFFGSILPAAWSLMLAMRARGIGTTWTSLLSARPKAISQILGVPDGVTQTVMLPAGYTLGATLKPADRLSPREVTYWNRWGELDI